MISSVSPKVEQTKVMQIFQEANNYCVYNSQLITEFSLQLFDAKYWQKINAIIGSAKGRGTTYFVQYQEQQWVLRHYYRGGLIGKLIKDSYFYNSLAKTRAAQEYNLLHTMAELGLPVPTPVAYNIKKSGLCYQADLLTKRIANAQDLVAILQNKPLTNNLWHAIGKTLKQFHQHGIYHHDLNCHNILIDNSDKIWLIDFDRCQQRPLDSQSNKWQAANLARLLRSFYKEKNKLANFYWQPNDWQSLLQGYQEA